jgi:hypothetical protein
MEFEYCPASPPTSPLEEEPFCPTNDGHVFNIEGQEIKAHCGTCWWSDTSKIHLFGHFEDMDACLKACADNPQCAGSNWFPESHKCNCHPKSTKGLRKGSDIGGIECIALEPVGRK